MDESIGGRLRGSCLCGAVRFEVTPPSLFCAHCHCSMCRRAHGAGYVTWFGVERSQLEVTDGAQLLARYRSSEKGLRSFCSVCGSTLFFETADRPDHVDVVLANMHDDIDLEPQMHVHFSDRVPWVCVHDELPRLGGETGLDPIEP
jgi:hypothetical protein